MRNILITAMMALMVSASASAQHPVYQHFWYSDEASTRVIDHSAWDQWLKSNLHYTSDQMYVDYARISVNAKKSLDEYIGEMLAITPKQYSWKQQKAYWVNLYNAVVLKGILEQSKGTVLTKPTIESNVKLTVDGLTFAVGDIRNHILRPIWKDYRVHFGLSCGTASCPLLIKQAYTPDTMRGLFSENARRYLSKKVGLELDRTANELRLSTLFRDYREDFADSDDKFIKTLALFSTDTVSLYLLGFKGTIIHNPSDSVVR